MARLPRAQAVGRQVQYLQHDVDQVPDLAS